MISDDDPQWEQHSGRDGHRGREWADGDEGLALELYDAVGANARRILDMLIDQPGEQLSADQIATQLGGSPDADTVESRRRGVAGSLATISTDRLTSRRRLPFYWWRGADGTASLYAMKPAVAEVFRDARGTANHQPGAATQPSHRSPTWTREEEVLALDLFVTAGTVNGGRIPSEQDERVIALSDELRGLPTHPGVPRDETFRNAASVVMKLANFRAVEKAVKTGLGIAGANMLPAGMPSFAALDRAIFEEYFSTQFDGLASDAQAIRASAMTAAGPETAGNAAEDRPVESAGTATYETAGAEGGRRSRSEHELVQRYVHWLAGRGIKAVSRLYRVSGLARPFLCDVFLPEKNALIEAKSSDSREVIRMAVGQLFDYQFLEMADRKLAVLLPYSPAQEIRELLDGLGIGVIWPVGEGFRDSHHGAFTRS